MADGYEVSTETLAEHATQADAAADRMEHAATAAGTLAPAMRAGGIEMFGALCGPSVVPAMTSVFRDTDAVISQVVDLTRACAEGVRVARQNYAAVEQAISELVERIEE